jgi:hypothetical protein
VAASSGSGAAALVSRFAGFVRRGIGRRVDGARCSFGRVLGRLAGCQRRLWWCQWWRGQRWRSSRRSRRPRRCGSPTVRPGRPRPRPRSWPNSPTGRGTTWKRRRSPIGHEPAGPGDLDDAKAHAAAIDRIRKLIRFDGHVRPIPDAGGAPAHWIPRRDRLRPRLPRPGPALSPSEGPVGIPSEAVDALVRVGHRSRGTRARTTKRWWWWRS